MEAGKNRYLAKQLDSYGKWLESGVPGGNCNSLEQRS